MENGIDIYTADNNTLTIFAALIIWLIHITALWRIFNKAGNSGWKSLIPVYSQYLLFRIAGKPLLFPIVFIFIIAQTFLNITSVYFTNDDSRFILLALWGIVIILGIITAIIYIDYSYSLSKAFGHGIAFAFGLIFLEPLFILILAFGRSQYRIAS